MASNFTWTCCKKDESKRKYLEDLLPQEYQYQILEFDLIKDNELFCEAKFEAKLKANVCSPQGLEVFLEKFKDISHTEWNKFKADSTDTKFFQQSGWRKCCHNVQKKVKNPQTGEMKSDKSKGKNTECESKLSFKLFKVDEHEHVEETCHKFSLELKLQYIHNHSVLAAASLQFHGVRQQTKVKFMELFIQGHSASSAYAEYKRSLKDLNQENFIQVSCDRAVMPDYRWCFNYFWLFKYKSFGKINSPEAFQLAIDRVTAFNQKHQDTVCVVKHFGDRGDFIVAYCDYLNRRVHEVEYTLFSFTKTLLHNFEISLLIQRLTFYISGCSCCWGHNHD